MISRSAILLLAAAALHGAPVKTPAGVLEGVPGNNPRITVYRGIPYAAPPVGPLRWQPPEPAARWTGVRRADSFGPRCLQGIAGLVTNSEDCLYLNVWTTGAGRRPVMLWLHGGGFTGGAGSQALFDGEALAEKGAVVVTINYRLGVFGFFAGGNYGLLDAAAALRWVRANITPLGGDPDNVTIFGESAGATMVACLTAMPGARGLFRRAIAESGSFGRALPHATPFTESLDQLRLKSASDIMETRRGTGPVIDGAVLPDDPATLFEQRKIEGLDLLIGANSDEGASSLRRTNAEQFTNVSRRRFGPDADRFLELYPADDANASQASAYRDEVNSHALLWAKLNPGRSFVYYFTHEPPFSPVQPWHGAFHTAEIPYVFHNFEAGRKWTAADQTLADQMSSYWFRFAATGDPNAPGLPPWPAYPAVKILGEATAAAPDAVRFAFWESQRAKPRRPVQ